ncbi:unnamed protein product [Mytilus edulis]|uniref:C2H2-type domain-containing protein n=1 Tax=Mytilus edulis TaxID=6550 RepID=A0A8S3T3M7_MYTED|nr:unnamed protein product [Mytilus edulis]
MMGKALGLTLGHIGCDRVAVSETINTHPRREIVENGVIFNEVPDSFKTKLVQPRDHYKRTDQAIVEGKSEIRCEDCETVFKKQEYLKRHTKNIHRVETIKKNDEDTGMMISYTVINNDDYTSMKGGDECFCGNRLNRQQYPSKPDSQCNKRCSGEHGRILKKDKEPAVQDLKLLHHCHGTLFINANLKKVENKPPPLIQTIVGL